MPTPPSVRALGMRTPAAAPLLATLLLSALGGCAGPGGGGVLGAQQHTLARDLTVAVDAGSVWAMDFTTRGGQAAYKFALTDDSSVDIGFMRTQNVQAWAEGSAANCYGCSTQVRAAEQATTLDAGGWSLVIRCRNALADCDGILESAWYAS